MAVLVGGGFDWKRNRQRQWQQQMRGFFAALRMTIVFDVA
jgi:hypothetical protein